MRIVKPLEATIANLSLVNVADDGQLFALLSPYGDEPHGQDKLAYIQIALCNEGDARLAPLLKALLVRKLIRFPHSLGSVEQSQIK